MALQISAGETGASARAKINENFADVAALQAAVGPSFNTVAALLADSTLTYATAPAGTIVEAGGFRYAVAALGDTDQHVTTAGGVKLYVQQGDVGFDAKAFGAVGNDAADDTAALLKTCQAANAASTQNVRIPAGTYRHTTLDLTDLNVRLIGDGSTETILRYIGANTADGIKFGTSQLATQKVNGCGLVQIGINGNSLARRAVEITSIYGGWFESVRIISPYEHGMYWTCLDNRLTNSSNEPADNQRCYINDLYVECVAVPTAVSLFFDGNAGTAATQGANTYLNHFENIRLNIRNGDGLVYGYADGNTLISFFVFRPTINTGVGLVFKEDTTGQSRHSRHNLCYNIQTAASSIVAEGSGVGQPSAENAIFGYNLGNTGVNNPPTIGSTATLSIFTNLSAFDLNASKVAVMTGNLTVTSAYLPLIRSRMTNESMRISNRANSNIVLERPSADHSTAEAAWNIAVLAASGSAGENLRILRSSGTGVFEAPCLAQSSVSATSGTTTLTNTSCVFLVDATAGNRIVVLPLAAAYGASRSPQIQIRRIDASANTVTVQRQSTDTLNGGTSETLAANVGKTYVADAVSAWYSF